MSYVSMYDARRKALGAESVLANVEIFGRDVTVMALGGGKIDRMENVRLVRLPDYRRPSSWVKRWIGRLLGPRKWDL